MKIVQYCGLNSNKMMLNCKAKLLNSSKVSIYNQKPLNCAPYRQSKSNSIHDNSNDQDAGMPYHKKILLKNREFHVNQIPSSVGTPTTGFQTQNLVQPSCSKFSIEHLIAKDSVEKTPPSQYCPPQSQRVKRDHCGTIKSQESVRKVLPTANNLINLQIFHQQQQYMRTQQHQLILNEKEIRMHCRRTYKIAVEISTIHQLREVCYNVNMLNSLPLQQNTQIGIFVNRTLRETFKMISLRLMGHHQINCHHPLPIVYEFVRNNFKQFRSLQEAQEYFVKCVEFVRPSQRYSPITPPPPPPPKPTISYNIIKDAPLNNCRETVIISAKKNEDKVERKIDESDDVEIVSIEIPKQSLQPQPAVVKSGERIEDWSMQVKKLLQESRFSPPPEKAKILQKVISYLTKQEQDQIMNILNKKVNNESKRNTSSRKISLPKGKLFYHRKSNTLLRYFDQDQVHLFLKNVNNNVQVKDDKSERYILDSSVVFSNLDKFDEPKDYLDEIKLVEKNVPEDFALFYKYVTAYQVRNHHEPISFQTFLLMYNTDGLNSLIENYAKSYL